MGIVNAEARAILVSQLSQLWQWSHLVEIILVGVKAFKTKLRDYLGIFPKWQTPPPPFGNPLIFGYF